MPSDMEKITIRTHDIELKRKLTRLADRNGRSLSREVEQILKRYVGNYEKKYGEIKIDR